MMRRMFGDRRASVITVFAFSACVFAVITALVVDQVTFYIGKRKLQAAADLAALMVIRSGAISDARAKSIVISQISDATGLDVKVTQGRYAPDATKAVDARFIAGATPANALQVDAVLPTKAAMMGGMLSSKLNLTVSARAARRTSATIMVGSRLVRLEGGLSQALLDSTLGYKGKLTVMDYNSLAAANVDAVQFLKALNTKANINAVSFDDVLDADVTVGQVIQALADVSGSATVSTALSKAAPVYSSAKFKLSDVISVGAIGVLPVDAVNPGGSAPVNVGEVLAASAGLSTGDHQVAVDLATFLGDNSIANATLDIGEKPQLLRYDAYSSPGTKVETSQFKLSVGALGKPPASVLAVTLNLASASVEIASINCASDGTASVTLKANTKAASASVKAPLLPALNLTLGSNEQKTLTFTHAEIQAQTWKPTRSSLGVQVGSLTIAQKLLAGPVDGLLVKLGLNVAEADVKVVDAECGSAGLVN